MRLSVRGLAVAGALLWGGCLLIVELLNLAIPTYGSAFLQGIGSVYPGLHDSRTFGDVILGAVYGAIDGGLGGAFIAWLYNAFAVQKPYA